MAIIFSVFSLQNTGVFFPDLTEHNSVQLNIFNKNKSIHRGIDPTDRHTDWWRVTNWPKQRIDESNKPAKTNLYLMSNTLTSSPDQSIECVQWLCFSGWLYESANQYVLLSIQRTNGTAIIRDDHWKSTRNGWNRQNTHTKEDKHTFMCTRPTRGLLASGLRGICWTARDCVMVAPPPPVSCVCAVTWWGYRDRRGGGPQEDGLRIKEPKSK